MRYGEKQPILIKEREMQATYSSPVITYRLTEEELEKYRKMGPIKKNAKKPIILENGPRKKKVEVEKMGEEKQVKKLTLEDLEMCLEKGTTEEQISKEYGKSTRVIKMLMSKLNNKTSKKDISLKITSLKGLMEYHVDHKNKRIFMQNEESTGAIGISFKDITGLITELQDL